MQKYKPIYTKSAVIIPRFCLLIIRGITFRSHLDSHYTFRVQGSFAQSRPTKSLIPDVSPKEKAIVQNGSLLIEDETTKTSKSRRTIALIPATIPYLFNLYQQQRASGLVPTKVCQWSNGKPVRQEYLLKKLHRIQAECGLEELRFHDLRGTSATLLESAGLSPKQIQAFLGHEDITTTMNEYVHNLDDGRRITAETMNSILENSPLCSDYCSD